jgi:hypothetical protein
MSDVKKQLAKWIDDDRDTITGNHCHPTVGRGLVPRRPTGAHAGGGQAPALREHEVNR